MNLRRKTTTYYILARGYKASFQSRGLVFAYALAVSEEYATGGTIVTAPTCGSLFTDGMHRVSFDKVVEVMKQTGNDLLSLYKETSEKEDLPRIIT